MTESEGPASLIDVARIAGCSKSTASRALLGQPGVSEATQRRVIDVAQRLGYVKDHRGHDLKSRATTSIGLYVRSARLSHYGELIEHLQQGLEAAGARMLVASASMPDPTDPRSFGELLGQRPDAVVVASGRIGDELLRTAARWTPLVVLGRHPDPGANMFSTADDGAGAEELALRVAAAGHRTVGVVTVSYERSATLHPRAEAMRRTLERVGVRVHDIAIDSLHDAPDPIALAGALPSVTAIMCPNDPILIATWEALADRGVRVPEDVSLTGYDGTGQLASCVLGLTTWRQPIEDLAAATLQLVCDAVHGRGSPRHVPRRGTFVPGRTLAAPRE